MANELRENPRQNTRSRKNHAEPKDEPAVLVRSTTPNRNVQNNHLDRDYSPVFLPCTQESLDAVDVLWDWNSPQSKAAYTRKKKRVQKAPSPKLPLKKHSSNNQLKTFDKLKEELRAFKEEINVLTRKPLDDFKLDLTYDSNRNQLDDLFEDSIEEQLLLVSQQIEEKFLPSVSKPEKRLEHDSSLNSKAKGSPRNLLKKSFSSNMLEVVSPVKRTDVRPPSNFKSKMQEMKDDFFEMNDSLDDIDIDNLTANFPSKHNDSGSMLKMKTKSLSFGDHYANTRVNVQKEADAKTRERIEMKRLEALAKLRTKKKTEFSDNETSPIKYSPEEIEVKRQQALAKLEAKKKQETIERNRLEALKRLELNRKKREVSQKYNMR